ncbi:ATP-dependent Clp protease proteolytic subunit [Xenorhabdus taiwanensis]
MIGNQSLDKVTKDTVRNDWMKPEEARDYGIAGQITHRWDKLHGY